ncbi:MAG: hypothetical protein JWQ03_3209 [Variovorax sp.]|nr:hypothetical protein [Variovorax sp.]
MRVIASVEQVRPPYAHAGDLILRLETDEETIAMYVEIGQKIPLQFVPTGGGYETVLYRDSPQG